MLLESVPTNIFTLQVEGGNYPDIVVTTRRELRTKRAYLRRAGLKYKTFRSVVTVPAYDSKS